MSLLNDMLRDLVKQQPTAKKTFYEQVARREAVYVDESAMTRYAKLSLFFILVFTLVLLAKNVFLHHDFYWGGNVEHLKQINSKPELLPQVPEVKSNKKYLEALPSQSQLVAALENKSLPTDAPKVIAGTSENSESHPLDEVTREKIDALLIHAKYALTQDKLTSPIEDNAFSDYQKVMQLDEQNAEARDGIEYIASRYIARAQEQLKLGNSQQAQAYFQRAEYVSPDYFQSVMETGAGFSESEKLLPATARSAAEREIPKTSVEKIQSKTEAVTKTQEVAKETNVEQSHLDIGTTSQWKDEENARVARELMNKQQTVDAKLLLERSLQNHFAAPKSIALLHEIYLQESNTQAADGLTNRADFMAEDQRSLLRAQSLVLQNKESQAIQLLEQHLSVAESNENYRALLASLYHKSNQYPLSIVQYQKLIQRFGDKPAYWLGLALGYDGLSQPKSAEHCYQQLKKFTQLQPQVLAYVDKRLSELQVH